MRSACCEPSRTSVGGVCWPWGCSPGSWPSTTSCRCWLAAAHSSSTPREATRRRTWIWPCRPPAKWAQAFAELGFQREGRYWHQAELDLLFEAPAPAGLPGEDAPRTETEVDGLHVVVIGIEDLLIDRLRAWVHWRSDEDGRWARRLALLYSDRIDWRYVLERAARDPAEARAAAQLREEAAQA